MSGRYGKFPKYAWARCQCGKVGGTVAQVRAHQATARDCTDLTLLDGPPEGYVPPRGSAIERLMVEQGLITPPADARRGRPRAATAAEDGAAAPSSAPESGTPAYPGGPTTRQFAREMLAALVSEDDEPAVAGPDGIPMPRGLRLLPPGPARPGADGTSPALPIQISVTLDHNSLNWYAWMRGHGYEGDISDYINDGLTMLWEFIGGQINATFDPARALVAV